MMNAIPDIRVNKKLLVVEDDPTQLLLLKMALAAEGYETIEATHGWEALEQLSLHPDVRLMITDLSMPHMDGFQLISSVRQTERRYTYIIVLTSSRNRKNLLQALSVGADDYLSKPLLPEELRLRLQVATRLLHLESQEELILSMAKIAEYRSQETGFHLERVKQYTRLLALDLVDNAPELGITRAMAEEISRVSPLHDIGKVAITDAILHKPGRLTQHEIARMQDHTLIGAKLLLDLYEKTGAEYLLTASDVARSHHEWWDGSGYPDGLQGEEIPVAAQIMALADVYDAMSSRRCYKPGYDHRLVQTTICQYAGSCFDPRLVRSFQRTEKSWLAIRQRFQDQHPSHPPLQSPAQ